MSDQDISLSLNIKAPFIKERDIFDRDVDTFKMANEKIFIAFFRHAGCPFCNVRIHALQKHFEELNALNLRMIFFFESTKELLLSNHFHKGISPVPIIADPERKYYDQFGVEQSAAKSTKSHLTTFLSNVVQAKMNKLPVHMMKGKESIKTIPAEFLVDKGGIIKDLHYSRSLTDRMHIDRIKNFAKS